MLHLSSIDHPPVAAGRSPGGIWTGLKYAFLLGILAGILVASPAPSRAADAPGSPRILAPLAPPSSHPAAASLIGAPAGGQGGATPTVTAVLPTVTPSPTATGSPTPVCGAAWRGVPVPGYNSELYSVAVLAPDNAWAVGDGSASVHWDGTAWSAVPAGGLAYYDIAAADPTHIWAVGRGSWSTLDALVFFWDGLTWQIIYGRPSAAPPADQPTTPFSAFTAVVATGLTEAYALRNPSDGFGGYSTELWRCSTSGCTFLTSLTQVSLGALAGVSATDLWAVGSHIYHWDGSTLAPVATITPGDLARVAAVAANDAWAVGYSAIGPTHHSLIEHWDGATWQPVPSPDIGELTGVAAGTATNIWAVGAGGILHWDGASWTVAISPPASLYAVAVGGTDDAWAVGGGGGARISLHYTAQAFVDVPRSQPFYPYVQWMACRAIISGYPCGGPGEPCLGTYFRPGNPVTRAQLLKIVVNAAGWPLLYPPDANRTFEDIPATHSFYPFIETGAARALISGYPCGGPGEPCVGPSNRPYFRAGANNTRGQLSKVIAQARGYPTPLSGGQTFTDVPPGSTFYQAVEQVAAAGIVSGYPCGTPGELCDPLSRPYFRPANNATRGQIAKIVTRAYGGP